MGSLDSKIEELVVFYLGRVYSKIDKIEKGEEDNGLVSYANFLDPVVEFAGDLPMNHTRGEAFYYHKIMRALEYALDHGRIPSNDKNNYELFLKSAPNEIRGLLDSSD